MFLITNWFSMLHDKMHPTGQFLSGLFLLILSFDRKKTMFRQSIVFLVGDDAYDHKCDCLLSTFG